MNIKLNWIHLKNFKGIKDFKLIAGGKNVSVFADNGKGKTTLQDAWNWLLFDKDSNNVADTKFTIKPQDKNGQDIHNLQTVVEAELLVDGKPIKLKKLREEKWVKPHGKTKKEFDRHEKSYWFNEIPCKTKKEYQTKVDELINENVFKMITDPAFFNTKLKWEDRRKILLEISGDATDEEVIASDESFARLTDILNGRPIDDYKAVLADKLKGLKKERDDLPPRIDELTLSLPQEEPDYTAVENEINKYKQDLASIEWLLVSARDKADEISKKYQALAKLKNQLKEVKEKIDSTAGAGRKKLIEKKAELEGGKYILESNIKNLKNDIEDNSAIEYGEKQLNKLRAEWSALDSKRKEIISWEFVEPSEDDFNCPTCNQPLPQDSKNAKIDEMCENFKQNKKAELDKVTAQLNKNKEDGLNTAKRHELNKQNKLSLEKELKEKEFKLENISISIGALNEKLSKPVVEPNYTKYPDYNELIEKIEQLQTELNKPVEDKSSELLQKKADIQAQIDELNKILNSKAETEKKKARIEELKAEEKRVSSLIAELEGHKYLLERFTVAKVNLLEDSINSQFKHVRFKLFEENITNEGIKPTCIALVNTNGAYVKYEDGNLAGRINAGLDIIQALSKFYSVQAPIFIDNRESVSEIIDISSQIINLIKPPTWDELDHKAQLALAGVARKKEEYSEEEEFRIQRAEKEWNKKNESLRVEVI